MLQGTVCFRASVEAFSIKNGIEYDEKSGGYAPDVWIMLKGVTDDSNSRVSLGNQDWLGRLPLSVTLHLKEPEVFDDPAKEQTASIKTTLVKQHIGWCYYSDAWQDKDSGQKYPKSLSADINLGQAQFNDIWHWARTRGAGDVDAGMWLNVFGSHLHWNSGGAPYYIWKRHEASKDYGTLHVASFSLFTHNAKRAQSAT